MMIRVVVTTNIQELSNSKRLPASTTSTATAQIHIVND